MQLTIDLSNREAVRLAIDLLRVALGDTVTIKDEAGALVGLPVIKPEDNPAAGYETNPFASAPATLPAGVSPLVPPGAPSTAGAAQLPTAPAAPSGGVPQAPNASKMPAPPIVPGAAVPQASAAPSSPAGVELDSEGVPWDERIHAGTKTKTQAGVWKAKKGLNDAAAVNAIKAELRARVGGAPAVPQTQSAATALPTPPAPFVPPAASSPPALPAAPSASAGPTTFDEFIVRVSAAVNSGTLPPTAANDAAKAHNMDSIVALQQYPDFVAHVWKYLKEQFPNLA